MPAVPVGSCSSTGIPIDIFYDTFGDPQDDPLLLIMGLGTQMIGWREPFCTLLAAAGFHVIRFDNRDVGLSSHLDDLPSPGVVTNFLRTYVGLHPHCCYTLGDMARDAIGLLDALKIPAAHIVGASMGGMIAQIMGLEYPDRVKSLGLIMTTTGERNLPGPNLRILAQMARPLPRDPESKLDHLVTTVSMLSSPTHFDPVAARENVRAAQERCASRAGFPRQSAAIMAAPGRRQALASLHIPCLVVHGRQDRLVPFAHGEDLVRTLPGCMTLFPDHMAHDLPAPVYEDLVSAIAANARRSKGP
jgi:pimeloyl-ACP methyl ester carboxylesterase